MIEFFVTTYNRKKITERCFENIKQIKFINQSHLSINDDGSTEYDKEFLLQYSNDVTITSNIGINEIMLRKIVEFKHSRKFSYFYSTDNDILHDPDAIRQLFIFYNKYHLPITLFNTSYHNKNLITTTEDAYIQKSFAGTSIFFSKEHLKDIPDNVILKMPNDIEPWWDWHLSKLLEKKGFVCPKVSYADHYITDDSLHKSYDDTGVNITPYLKIERLKM